MREEWDAQRFWWSSPALVELDGRSWPFGRRIVTFEEDDRTCGDLALSRSVVRHACRVCPAGVARLRAYRSRLGERFQNLPSMAGRDGCARPRGADFRQRGRKAHSRRFDPSLPAALPEDES